MIIILIKAGQTGLTMAGCENYVVSMRNLKEGSSIHISLCEYP